MTRIQKVRFVITFASQVRPNPLTAVQHIYYMYVRGWMVGIYTWLEAIARAVGRKIHAGSG